MCGEVALLVHYLLNCVAWCLHQLLPCSIDILSFRLYNIFSVWIEFVAQFGSFLICPFLSCAFNYFRAMLETLLVANVCIEDWCIVLKTILFFKEMYYCPQRLYEFLQDFNPFWSRPCIFVSIKFYGIPHKYVFKLRVFQRLNVLFQILLTVLDLFYTCVLAIENFIPIFPKIHFELYWKEAQQNFRWTKSEFVILS